MIYEQDESDDFKCTLCKDLFCPPHNLPYLLPCTHSICTNCINKITINHHSQTVICPQDLETSYLSDLRLNYSTRKALQRLVKQHKNFSQNNQLFRIQALSKHFQQILEFKSKEKDECKQLLQTIIEGEITRLKLMQKRFNQQLQGPFKKVEQWRNIVKQYLFNLKSMNRSCRGEQIFKELNFYIDQGRRIKCELNHYQQLKFDQISSLIASNPKICLQSQFTLKRCTQRIDEQNHKIHTLKQPIQTIENKRLKYEEINQQRLELSTGKIQIEQKAEKLKYEPLHEISIENDSQKNKNLKTSQSSNKEVLLKNQNIFICKNQQDDIKIRNNKNKSQNSAFSNITKKQHLFMLSEDDSIPIMLVRQEIQNDEILLTEKQEAQMMVPNINFMQQWQIVRSLPSEHIQTRKRQPFNWQKEKNQYIKKMQLIKVQQAKNDTIFQNGCLQLINYSLSQVEIYLYLQCWDWKNIQTIKFVRTGFADSQLNELLNFMVHCKVETLVLCGNNLSEVALDALLNFVKMNKYLQNVYISKNNMNLLRGRSREKVSLLRQKGINLYT